MDQRYDDDHRGPGVADAISLAECWLRLRQAKITWPERPFRSPLAEIIHQYYPEDQREQAAADCEAEECAMETIIEAILLGTLPVWYSPKDGPEKVAAPEAFLELQKESIICGTYRPPNDRGYLYGRPLFVKRSNWQTWIDDLKQRYRPQNTAGIEKRAQLWLRGEFESGAEGVRSDFLNRAHKLFPSLSVRGFNDRIWRPLAEEFGRNRAGRPKNRNT